MKKLLIMVMLLLTVLSGCGQIVVANDDEIKIAIKNSTKADIRTMVMCYCVNEEPLGVMRFNAMDESVLKGTHSFMFDEMSFPEGCERENLSFNILLLDYVGFDIYESVDPQHAQETNEMYIEKREYGKVYHYELIGSFEEGFQLTEINK